MWRLSAATAHVIRLLLLLLLLSPGALLHCHAFQQQNTYVGREAQLQCAAQCQQLVACQSCQHLILNINGCDVNMMKRLSM